jgi:DNA-binding transcriptional LysR family regulator
VADRFEDLRTFLTIVSAGGVNAAASGLGIAQSAVSRSLSDLERRLGVALMDRSHRRFELTATGFEYARRARAVLTSLDELDASVEPRSERPIVKRRAPSVILTHAIVPALAAIRERLEETQVLVSLFNDDGNENDEAPDVLITDRMLGGDREPRLLFTSTLLLCAAPSHLSTHDAPREPRDLDLHPAIVIGRGEPEWHLGEQRRTIAQVSLISDDIDAAAAAAVRRPRSGAAARFRCCRRAGGRAVGAGPSWT